MFYSAKNLVERERCLTETKGKVVLEDIPLLLKIKNFRENTESWYLKIENLPSVK